MPIRLLPGLLLLAAFAKANAEPLGRQGLGRFCICPLVKQPVCGYDGVSYDSFCHLQCAQTYIACAGACPCAPPGGGGQPGPDGCSQLCIPLDGPAPLPPPPPECEGGMDGVVEEEDVIIQSSCNRYWLWRHKQQESLREFCYQVCDVQLHFDGNLG